MCRRLLLVLAFLGLAATASSQANGKLQIHYMNVGQGDGAVLISPAGQVVLFDLGVKNQCGGPLAYLQSLGLTKIDYIVLSHYHSDHLGCAATFLNAFPLVGISYDRGGSYSTIAYNEYASAVAGKRQTAAAGQGLTLDAATSTPVYVDFVALNGAGLASTDENDLSLVAKVRFGDFEAVFAGDLGGANTGVVDPDPNPDPQTLSVSVNGSGTVTSSAGGISCPGTCSAQLAGNTAVTLTATPAFGWTFTGWGGACAGTGPCTVSMTTAQSVSATFTIAPPATQSLTVVVSGSGTVSSNPAGISCPGVCSASFATGSAVTLSAATAAGASFTGWSGACSGTGACTVTMSAARSVTATFKVPTYKGYPACTGTPSPTYGTGCSPANATLGCKDGMFSCSQNTQGACSGGHNGIKCVVCPGLHCVADPLVLTLLAEAGLELEWPEWAADVATPESYADVETVVAPLVGQVEVYKVNHHGSRYSSNQAWMNIIRPAVSIISTGSGNGYGHPTPEALSRIHSVGSKTYWTSGGAGAVLVPGTDYVGGHILVEVARGATTFTVRSGLFGTHTYPLWNGGRTPEDTTTDTDADTLPDSWETKFGLSANSSTGNDGASGDPDGDGKTNQQEYQGGTHPRGFFTRYFAEGATSDLFDTSLAFLNTSGSPANVLLRFQQGNGSTVPYDFTMGPLTRRTLDVSSVAGMTTAEFSTVIESDRELVADRTMTWDSSGYGSHAETSISAPETTWYLAEGATHSGFDLFYLIQNPNDQATSVHVKYLLPSGAPIEKDYAVAARSRFNIWVDADDPRLASTDVSAVITTGLPTIVERAMYLSAPGRLFNAGHESAGITTPATEWFLAEGATGEFFDLFVLIANPGNVDAAVTATFLLPDGTSVVQSFTAAANSRANLWVDTLDPRLVDTAVSTIITSTNGVPIIVERSMWWPGPTAATWSEAHNSAGLTSTGRTWALAEGEVGGSRGVETYILIANRGAADTARVTLYFEDGTSDTKTVPLPASSRTNVSVAFEFPSAVGRRFGAIVEALGANPQIAVERAVYSNAGGVFWAAGTNAVATKLQ